MKALKFRVRTRAVPTEHPDGGVFHLFPFDTEKALDWKERIESAAEEGKTAKQKWLDCVAYIADNVVERITNVVDVETGEEVVVDEEIKRLILAEVSARDVEVDVPDIQLDASGVMVPVVVDGKRVTHKETRQANEPYFLWAMNEAAKLVQRREEEAKNS